VIVERHRGEVGVGKLVVRNISTVDLELDLVIVGAIVTEDVHSTSGSRGEVLHRMIVIELLDLGTRSSGLLNLSDDHVLRSRSEVVTLGGIKVRVVSIDIIFSVRVGGEGAPGNTKLNVVILESDEREGSLPVLTEGKSEGVEVGVGGTTEEITGDGFGGSSRRESGSNESGVNRVLLINHLTTNEELNLRDEIGPITDLLSDEAVVDDKVDIVEEVTLALEAHGRHTIVGYVTLDHLAFHGLREVSMALISRSEKADFGLTDEVHILSTDSDELGNTTRHFILYREFIFKLSCLRIWEYSL
jgi:hypothetical protein